MDDQQRHSQLIQHLVTAGSAHGEYEAVDLQGVYDEQWAEWYAQYLITHGWNDLFERTWTESELTAELRRADHDHRVQDTARPWQEFYAESFIKVE